MEPPADSPATRPYDLLCALRPNQWTKNAVVAAAFFFVLGDRSQTVLLLPALLRTLAAVALFCAVSSGIYILNDLHDLEADRQHPEKRYRPIASGRVPLRLARMLSAALLFAGLGLGFLLSPEFAGIAAAYVVLQVFYTFGLKRIELVDILVIAIGFVIRAMAGAFALAVPISPWLLLCAFLLALFLAVCKRRHEKVQVGEVENAQRESLNRYDPHLLDQLIAIVASATIVSYAMYTLSQQTVDKFGTAALGFTIPFVVFGIFRYLDLVYRHRMGDRPEKIVLNDLPILLNLGAYALTVLAVFALSR